VNPLTLDDIAHTQQISAIVDAESTRLDKKKVGLDIEQQTHRRNIQLNQSYARRMRQYAYMMSVVVIALTICVILGAANSVMPSALFTTGIVVVFSVGAVWAFNIYLDIIKRDLADFNQVSSGSLIDTAKLITPTTASDAAAGVTGTGGKITGPVSACAGKECCGPDTNWDDAKLKCIPTSVSTFDTLSRQYATPAPISDAYSTKLLPNTMRKLGQST